jgi:hypothetical protein
MAEPDRDDADVSGRLLIRVYEIHKRVIARGGGGLEGIRDKVVILSNVHSSTTKSSACVGLAEEGQRFAEGNLVTVQTVRQIAEWCKGLVAMPASEET